MEGTVILLSHEYPPYVFGGVATFSKSVVEWLSERGWRVFAVVGKAGFRERILVDRVNDGLTIVRLYFPEIPPRWLLYAGVVRSYVERLVDKGCRIVLSNNPLTSLAISESSRRKLKVVTFFHGSIYSLFSLAYYTPPADLTKVGLPELAYCSETPLINYLTKRDLLLSDTYIFIAKHVMEEFRNIYVDLAKDVQDRGVVMYPGIEYARLASLRANIERADKGKVVIAFVGRLYYMKGVVHAIKAVEALLRNSNAKDVELWVFGKGSLESWVRSYIKRVKELKDRVRLFGFVKREKLMIVLAKYVNVLLHPSLYEGAPLAIIEACTLGIPVVTYDLLWAKEFVFDGINGYKEPYPFIDKLADGIIQALKLRNKIPLNLAEKYDRTKTFTKLESIIASMM